MEHFRCGTHSFVYMVHDGVSRGIKKHHHSLSPNQHEIRREWFSWKKKKSSHSPCFFLPKLSMFSLFFSFSFFTSPISLTPQKNEIHLSFRVTNFFVKFSFNIIGFVIFCLYSLSFFFFFFVYDIFYIWLRRRS